VPLTLLVGSNDTLGRKKVPSYFVDALASIGVPTGKFEMETVVDEWTGWSECERRLIGDVCPKLELFARRKVKTAEKKAAAAL